MTLAAASPSLTTVEPVQNALPVVVLPASSYLLLEMSLAAAVLGNVQLCKHALNLAATSPSACKPNGHLERSRKFCQGNKLENRHVGGQRARQN